MRYLIDTHVFIAVSRKRLHETYPMQATMLAGASPVAVSVATFWEIAIKVRLGKLDAGVPLDQLGSVAAANNMSVIAVMEQHATYVPTPDPDTRDPFGRLLLAVAQLEGMRLVTIDRALAVHPVAAPP